ncbi:MAG: hypothetical protein HY741_01580 [Chloroflexi bacterium]|nr:hypothetical protein [Chloroflexota bacterium]
MKILQLCFIFAFSVLFVGCGVIGMQSMTPQQVVARANPPNAGEQRVYATKPAGNGALVVLRALNPPAGEFLLGYGIATKGALGWESSEGGSAGGTADNTKPLYLYISSQNTPPNRNLVYGMVNDPRVQTVVAQFANGQTIQDEIENGLFGIVAEPKSALCRIDFRDARLQNLYGYDFTQALDDDPAIFGADTDWAKKECQ